MGKAADSTARMPKDGLKVGLLLLPPEGWEAEAWLERAVTGIWNKGVPPVCSIRRLEADPEAFSRTLKAWTDRRGFDVVCVVGRSGHGPEDFVPDRTRPLLHRSLPGVEERMYLASPRQPEDLLFRGAAGIRKETLILNLPGRPGRIRTVLRFLAPVLGHALEKMTGDESECAAP